MRSSRQNQALSKDNLQQEEGTVATMVAVCTNVTVLPSLKKRDDDVASYYIAKGLCKSLFLGKVILRAISPKSSFASVEHVLVILLIL